MKSSALAFTLLVMIAVVLFSFSSNVRTVEAANSEYSVENVQHTLQVMYNGYVLVNDTIRILGKASSDTASLEHFLIGFPNKYGQHVLRSLAYNASRTFKVSLDVPLENRMSFYGMEVTFPQPLRISNGTTNVFTVVTVLSNDLLTQNPQNTSLYTLDFPGYPSLTETAAVCNVSIALPLGAQLLAGTVRDFTYGTGNLSPFTYSPASVTFLLIGDMIQIFDINGMSREINVNEFGGLEGSDTYRIRNRAPKQLDSVELLLPPNASDPSAQEFGTTMANPDLIDSKTYRYKVTFTSSVSPNESTTFTLKYSLPSDAYFTKQQEMANSFNLTFPLFHNVTYYIEGATVTFVFPEGAKILSFEKTFIGQDYSVVKGVFQETLTIGRQGVISLDGFNFGVVYEYNPLWLSFRPALWMWALAVVGCAIAVVGRRPKAAVRVVTPAMGARLRTEDLISFRDSYEEKMKIASEIDSLEAKVQKGRIPRRRYKVQRKALETRLNALSRSLTEVKEKMYAAGGHYSELMRQVEIAETDINEAETNIKSIEARHSRGELSLEAYRKLLADYQRRKERADTAIDGVLLRLREEIR